MKYGNEQHSFVYNQSKRDTVISPVLVEGI